MPKLTYTAPPPSLMRELREVATDASLLSIELAKANRLPADFPVDQLQELLVDLQSLPAGTAEGSRQSLEYARARLPAIRRQFIQTEEQSLQQPPDSDAPPRLTRGMTIDLRIGALVNSVTTALDEYRALASVRNDDTTDTAPSLEIDAMAPDAVAAMATARNAEHTIDAHVDELDRITEPNSVAADNLKRQMRDTRVLLSLARIELRMPAFVPRWFHKTIETISDYPRILRGTVQVIQIGVDVARPLVDAWHDYKRGYSSLVLDTIEQAATGLSAVAQKWEEKRVRQRDERTTDDTQPPLDFDLEIAHVLLLRGEPPPSLWRPWIKALNFSGRDVSRQLRWAAQPRPAQQELNNDEGVARILVGS